MKKIYILIICSHLLSCLKIEDSNPITSQSGNQNQNELLPNVTIAVATYEKRHEYHEFIYELFKAQDYKGKLTLLLYDNGDQPSPFFSTLTDSNVRYLHTTKKSSALSLGAKRNWLAENADGEIVVVWDDDDFYGRNYVSFMVESLIKNKAHLVKPTEWLMAHFNQKGDAIEFHMVKPENTKFGWGFGFVFKKIVLQKCKYADLNRIEEDYFAQCIYNQPDYKVIWQQWKPLDEEPIQIKFESHTPKNQTNFSWESSFEFFYGNNGKRRPGSVVSQAVIKEKFTQFELLKKYIDKYLVTGKK